MPIIIGDTSTQGSVSQVDICNLALMRLGESKITTINEGTKKSEHCSMFWDYVLDEVLNDHDWQFAKKAVTLDYATGFNVYTDSDIFDISNITQAAPPVVTAASHTFLDGHFAYIYDVSGMTEVNQRVFEVTAVSGNDFSLLGMDSSPWTASRSSCPPPTGAFS